MGRISIGQNRIPTLTGRSVPLPRTAPYTSGKQYMDWALQVKRRAGFTCERCGRNGVRMFADHIVEVKDGGAIYDAANGQCLCGGCHNIKTSAEKTKRAARFYG